MLRSGMLIDIFGEKKSFWKNLSLNATQRSSGGGSESNIIWTIKFNSNLNLFPRHILTLYRKRRIRKRSNEEMSNDDHWNQPHDSGISFSIYSQTFSTMLPIYVFFFGFLIYVSIDLLGTFASLSPHTNDDLAQSKDGRVVLSFLWLGEMSCHFMGQWCHRDGECAPLLPNGYLFIEDSIATFCSQSRNTVQNM